MARRASIPFLFLLFMIPSASDGQRFELSPQIGYRLGGSLEALEFREELDLDESESSGLAFSISLGDGFFLEFLYSRQETQLEEDRGFFGGSIPVIDLDVDYWHGGFLFELNPQGTVRPFFTGTLGATIFDPASPALGNETRFSLGFGGGVKLMATEHFGIRLEGRGYSTFVDTDTEVFCDPFSCYGYIDNDLLWQFEARVGLVFAF